MYFACLSRLTEVSVVRINAVPLTRTVRPSALLTYLLRWAVAGDFIGAFPIHFAVCTLVRGSELRSPRRRRPLGLAAALLQTCSSEGDTFSAAADSCVLHCAARTCRRHASFRQLHVFMLKRVAMPRDGQMTARQVRFSRSSLLLLP